MKIMNSHFAFQTDPLWLNRREHGGALVEFTIVVLFLVLVLIASPDAIPQLMEALRNAYTSFVYALSISWF